MAGDVLGSQPRHAFRLTVSRTLTMPTKPAEDLETFLKRQDPSTLVSVLIDLANDHEAVQERLARLQMADHPDKLAAGFRKTLTAWRRSSKFFTYREAGEFGRTLEAWLEQVARELLPRDPAFRIPPDTNKSTNVLLVCRGTFRHQVRQRKTRYTSRHAGCGTFLDVVRRSIGAAGGDRTHDPWLRRPILYPLSYSRA